MAANAAAVSVKQPFRVHAACLFDMADLSLLPAPSESYLLDISDAAVRRLAVGASGAAGLLVLAGLSLAYSVG